MLNRETGKIKTQKSLKSYAYITTIFSLSNPSTSGVSFKGWWVFPLPVLQTVAKNDELEVNYLGLWSNKKLSKPIELFDMTTSDIVVKCHIDWHP
jgi:hypothetical protein